VGDDKHGDFGRKTGEFLGAFNGAINCVIT
jgi:hypothetical protein